jgi:O-antigen ligase
MFLLALILIRRPVARLTLIGLAVIVTVLFVTRVVDDPRQGGEHAVPGFNVSQSASVASRLELWDRALTMLRDAPFTGVGLAAFPVVMDAFYPGFIAGPDARIPHAHNLLFQSALDLGLPGALAVIGLAALSLSGAWLAMRRAPRLSFEWCLACAAAIAIVVIGVHGLVDAGLWAARSSPVIWVFLGLGLAVGATRRVDERC